MPRRSSPPGPLAYDYVRRTRQWPVNLLFLMPWVLVYELALLGTRSPVENAAAAWLRALARSLGPTGLVLASLGVALGLAVVLLLRLRDAVCDRGVFGGMMLEGLCYGALLGTLAGALASGLPLGRVTLLSHPHLGLPEGVEGMRLGMQELGLAVGAGIFEELVFRGALLAGLYGLLRHAVGTDRWSAGGIAVLVSAYVFSDYHHWGLTGEIYDAHVFTYRFYAGILLGTIFLTRGLGIAALAHGFYDALVLFGR